MTLPQLRIARHSERYVKASSAEQRPQTPDSMAIRDRGCHPRGAKSPLGECSASTVGRACEPPPPQATKSTTVTKAACQPATYATTTTARSFSPGGTNAAIRKLTWAELSALAHTAIEGAAVDSTKTRTCTTSTEDRRELETPVPRCSTRKQRPPWTKPFNDRGDR